MRKGGTKKDKESISGRNTFMNLASLDSVNVTLAPTNHILVASWPLES
jgi:hypothetical protein